MPATAGSRAGRVRLPPYEVEQDLQLLHMPIRYGGVPGATDGTFLWAWAGLPIVTIELGSKTAPHRADEYV